MSGQSSKPAPKSHPQPDGRPVRIEPRIFIVDDDEESFVLVSHVLKKAGVTERMEWIGDGGLLIDRLSAAQRDKHGLPMLIVLDLKMPRVNGFEVLTWMRDAFPGEQRPVTVVMSSSGRAEDMTRALQLGALCYFEKFPSAEKFVVVYKLAKARLGSGGPMITT